VWCSKDEWTDAVRCSSPDHECTQVSRSAHQMNNQCNSFCFRTPRTLDCWAHEIYGLHSPICQTCPGSSECAVDVVVRHWTSHSFYISCIEYTACKSKRKVVLCLTKYHAVKTYRRSGGIGPHILNLGTTLKWVFSFPLRPLNPRVKAPLPYPLNRRLGGPQSRSGQGSGKK